MERHRRKKHYEAVRDIQRILQREQNKKTWGPCSLLNGKPRASPPLAVKIPDEFGEYVKYATKGDLNREVGKTLEKRYRMGCLAPICSSALGSQLGHLAINDVAMMSPMVLLRFLPIRNSIPSCSFKKHHVFLSRRHGTTCMRFSKRRISSHGGYAPTKISSRPHLYYTSVTTAAQPMKNICPLSIRRNSTLLLPPELDWIVGPKV